MKKTKSVAPHTPGPWTLAGPTGDHKRIIVCNDYDGWHSLDVEVDSDDCDYDTAMANAKLIAAAPELLDACQAVVKALDHRNASLDPASPNYANPLTMAADRATAQQKVLAAIAKATQP